MLNIGINSISHIVLILIRMPADVSIDGTKGECSDGKYQSFYFGPVNNTKGIPYIQIDANEIHIRNVQSQRVSIPTDSTEYCVSNLKILEY